MTEMSPHTTFYQNRRETAKWIFVVKSVNTPTLFVYSIGMNGEKSYDDNFSPFPPKLEIDGKLSSNPVKIQNEFYRFFSFINFNSSLSRVNQIQ